MRFGLNQFDGKRGLLMKFRKLILGAGLIGCAVLAGCGAASSSSADYTSRMISGTASGGLGISAKSIVLDNYMIWAQNVGSQRVYFANFEADGRFNLEVETTKDQNKGNRFIMLLVRKDPLSIVGTLTASHDVSAGSAATGIAVNGDISGFSITFNPDAFKAIVQSADADFEVDQTFKTRLSSDVPVGMGNAGKGAAAVTGSVNSTNFVDKDEDGIPDLFDAMNDGQILDNRSTENIYDAAKASNTVKSVIMFMNLKVQKENQSSVDMVTENASVVIQVNPYDSAKISHVEAYLVNTHYSGSTVDLFPNGFTYLDSTPWPAGVSWNASTPPYKLYKVNALGTVVWTVLVKPMNNRFVPGDLVLLKVTTTSGATEYYWTSINFKFKTLPTDTTSWLGGAGTVASPYVTAASGNVSVSWTAPKDEAGNDLAGVNYRLELFYYDSSGNPVGSRTVINAGTDVTSVDIPEATFDSTQSLHPGGSVQVDITASYPYGDNAANIVRVKRSGW